MTLNKWLILEQYSLGFNYLHIPTHQFSQGLKTHTGNKIFSLYTTSQIINIRSWNNLPKRFYSRQKQEILLDLCNLLMTSKLDSPHNANSNCWKHVWIMKQSPQRFKVKVAQSCRTLYDPMDYIIHGILQARILEWAAIPFSRGSSQPRD